MRDGVVTRKQRGYNWWGEDAGGRAAQKTERLPEKNTRRAGYQVSASKVGASEWAEGWYRGPRGGIGGRGATGRYTNKAGIDGRIPQNEANAMTSIW